MKFSNKIVKPTISPTTLFFPFKFNACSVPDTFLLYRWKFIRKEIKRHQLMNQQIGIYSITSSRTEWQAFVRLESMTTLNVAHADTPIKSSLDIFCTKLRINQYMLTKRLKQSLPTFNSIDHSNSLHSIRFDSINKRWARRKCFNWFRIKIVFISSALFTLRKCNTSVDFMCSMHSFKALKRMCNKST